MKSRREQEFDDSVDDPFDQLEVFELIRYINDPEYPLTLEQLGVVSFDRVAITDEKYVDISYTPTIPHCSMAQIIGLMIKVKLLNNLPKSMKVTVKITPGTHVKELDINKQINDKERVAAATENPNILKILRRGFKNSDRFNFKT
jgi:metal-sulfur cluster biosynthetic enzyme